MDEGVRHLSKAMGLRGLKTLCAASFAFLAATLAPLEILYAANPATLTLNCRVDLTPPAAISDLIVQKATGTEGAVVLSWTEPGDDGMSGQASAYLVRYSTAGNINNLTDFSTAAVYNSGWAPGSGGSIRMQVVNGLVPGSTYFWAIRAQDGAGLLGSWSRSAGANPANFAPADDEPPAQVQGVTALSGTQQVNLSWTPLTPAEKTVDFDFYRIYRSTRSDLGGQVVLATTSASAFADSPLSLITTYYYRVVGVDKGQTSTPTYAGDSLESLAWSTASALPALGAPSGFSAATATANSITWQWTDNASYESGFSIYSTTGGLVGQTGPATGTGGLVQWLETGLISGTSYQRYVVSVQTGTASAASNSALKYTLANAPLTLVSSTQTTGSLALAWDANNNSSYTHYILEVATYPSVSFAQIADVTTTSLVNTNLAEATSYTYRLRARNGEGLDSATLQLTTATLMVPPAAVADLSLSAGPFAGSVVLRWTAPGDDGNSGNIAGGLYDVRWSTNAIATDADFNAIPNPGPNALQISTNAVAGSQQGLLIGGLPLNTLVYFALKTRDEVSGNFAAISNIASGFPQIDVTSPSATGNLTGVLLSSTSARLTWTAPGDDGTSGNNAAGAYDVRYASMAITSLAQFQAAPSASAFGTIPSPQAPGSTETMTLNGLALDATYYFALRTQDEVPNYSPISNSTRVITPDFLAPGAVQNLVVTANAAVGRRVDLNWTNPAAADLKGIRIVVSTSGFLAQPSTAGVVYFDLPGAALGSAPTSFGHGGLTAGVTYYYTLFAFDNQVSPNFSAGVSASAAALVTKLGAPGRPRNMAGLRSASGNAFSLNWDAPLVRADGTLLGAGELASYEVLRTDKLTGLTTQVALTDAASSTTYTDSPVLNKLYYYRVRAVNIAGLESADSDILGMPEQPAGIPPDDGDLYVIMNDSISYIRVPGAMTPDLYANGVQLSGQRVISEEGGRVFKSVNVQATDAATGQPKKGYVFNGPVQVAIAYMVGQDGKITNGSPALATKAALPDVSSAQDALSIYWNNGAEWIKLGTNVDPRNNSVYVKSRQTGGYQLRLVYQADVQGNSVFPRTITPNGDGINDVVFFFFENKTGAPAQGGIYDLKSAKVADVRQSDIFAGDNTVLTWDGKDGSGAVVAGGVYLYKIQIGDKTFTGSVVVAR